MLQDLFSTVKFQFFNVLHFYNKSSPIFWLPAVFPLSCSPTWCWGGERTISPTTAFPSFQFRSHRLLWRYISLSCSLLFPNVSVPQPASLSAVPPAGAGERTTSPDHYFPFPAIEEDMICSYFVAICSSQHCLSFEKILKTAIFTEYLDKNNDQNHDLEIIVCDQNGWKKGTSVLH